MTRLKPDCTIAQRWVVSSEEERFLDAEEVTGSIPVPPTINRYEKGDAGLASPFNFNKECLFHGMSELLNTGFISDVLFFVIE